MDTQYGCASAKQEEGYRKENGMHNSAYRIELKLVALAGFEPAVLYGLGLGIRVP